MTGDGDKTRGPSRDNEILTIEEIAAYLRLKLGKEWRFRKSIIDRWLDEQILSSESGFEHLKK